MNVRVIVTIEISDFVLTFESAPSGDDPRHVAGQVHGALITIAERASTALGALFGDGS